MNVPAKTLRRDVPVASIDSYRSGDRSRRHVAIAAVNIQPRPGFVLSAWLQTVI